MIPLPLQNSLIEQIDAWLPQTQCTRCGYPRCRAYAEAMASGQADINQCPPGGEVTIRALASLLGVASKPLNPEYGVHEIRKRAVIDETICIGCAKCLQACPVDAILGAAKLMHTVIAQECTGCGLCVVPCPVDCIAMLPVTTRHEQESWPEYQRAEQARWRTLTQRRLARLARQTQKRSPQHRARAGERERIRAEIRAAVERVRNKKRAAT